MDQKEIENLLNDGIDNLDVDRINEAIEKGVELNKHYRGRNVGLAWNTPLANIILLADDENLTVYVPIFRRLLEAGADPNFPTEEGFYPLYLAIKNFEWEFAKYLLDFGADTELANQKMDERDCRTIIQAVRKQMELKQLFRPKAIQKTATMLLEYKDFFSAEEQKDINSMRLEQLFQ